MYPFNKEELIQKFDGLSKTDAKNGLEEFAHATWGIDLNKKKTFDNMLVELEETLTEAKTKTVEAPVEHQEESMVEDAVVVPEVVETPSESITEAHDDFVPSIHPHGPGNGYINLSWWFYEWIVAHGDDWKTKIGSCRFYNAEKTLKSLVYYIKRDGSVMIRETRNSKFVSLV